MDIVGSLVRIADFSLGREDIIVAIAEREGKARIEGKAETDVGRYRITRIDAPDQHVADHFIHVARDVIEIGDPAIDHRGIRSEEHTSELQSLMSNSYAVFCLQKKKQTQEMNHGRSYRQRGRIGVNPAQQRLNRLKA